MRPVYHNISVVLSQSRACIAEDVRFLKGNLFAPVDLVILGCSVSEEIIFAVVQEIERIRPMLNLHLQPPAINLSPVLAKQYMEENTFRSCVLVVDGERIKDAYENPLALTDEYEALLKTAMKKIGKIRHKLCRNFLSLPFL